jgi:hypothetical protein
MVVRVFLDITEDFFYVNIENAESMKFAIFPLIPKESIFVYNFLFVHNNMLYAYSFTQLLEDVKIKRVGPYIINPANMIGRRMDIMASWVRGEFLSSSVLP